MEHKKLWDSHSAEHKGHAWDTRGPGETHVCVRVEKKIHTRTGGGEIERAIDRGRERENANDA